MNGNTVSKIRCIDTTDILSQQLQITLLQALSKALGISAADIDPHRPLVNYGLDSIDAVMIASDFEDWLDMELPSTLLWDYPTVAAISGFIEHQLETTPKARARVMQAAVKPQKERAANMAGWLDGLSADELDELIAELVP